MSRIVQALIEEHGATPICAVDHRVDFTVLAPVRGVADPSVFGHLWVKNGTPIWCLSQVLEPASEAEKEAASA